MEILICGNLRPMRRHVKPELDPADLATNGDGNRGFATTPRKLPRDAIAVTRSLLRYDTD